jgi:DNA-binding FadR family transcriptional regulator
MDPIAPLSRVARPVDAVVQRLRHDVLNGTFPAGGHLPPERQLAVALGVSRLTLRAALARLEAEGLVRARQGEGVRVLDLAQHGTLAVLAHMDLAARPEVVRSFLELRRAVAAEAVAMACERVSKKDLEALARMAAEQAQETDVKRYASRDVAFGRAVLVASESFAALLVFNALAPVYEAHPQLTQALMADKERSLAGYFLTVELLRARDGAAARTVVREALEHVDAAALATLSPRKSKAKAKPKAKR